jgi:hypothetical protein
MQSPVDPNHVLELGLMSALNSFFLSSLNAEDRIVVKIRNRDFVYPWGFHKISDGIFDKKAAKAGKVSQPMILARQVN